MPLILWYIIVGFVSICTQDAYFQHRASTAKRKKKKTNKQKPTTTNKTITTKKIADTNLF